MYVWVSTPAAFDLVYKSKLNTLPLEDTARFNIAIFKLYATATELVNDYPNVLTYPKSIIAKW